MRQTQRRRLLLAAREIGEQQVAKVAETELHKRFQILKRELRQANLRKRIKKLDGSPLVKADGDWQWWIDEFNRELQKILGKQVKSLANIEDAFFAPSGKPPKNWDPDQVILDYQDRVGLKITNIPTDTLNMTQERISTWYQGQGTLPDLIASLSTIYNPSRAELIASTEMNFLASEISLQQMQYMDIGAWLWDAFADACSICGALQAQSQVTPFKPGDPMPPDASHPRCRCGVLYADSTGKPLTYGADVGL
jgi:hypothetical protein